MSECLAELRTGLRKGEVCGRDVRGFLARGVPRCGFHLKSVREIRAVARARAARQAVREMYELRGVPPDEDACGDEHNASSSDAPKVTVDADGTAWTWE